MGNFLESILGIASAVPGSIGTIAGVGGSLLGINKAQNKANKVQDELQGLAGLLSSGFRENSGALTDGLLQSSGINTDRRTAAQKAQESRMTALSMLKSQGVRGPSLASHMAQLGITQADVDAYDAASAPQYDPSFNPYSSLLADQYSPEAISRNAASLYDPASLTPQLANMEAASRNSYDGAARSAEADAARRGVLQGSGSASAINQIRAAQGAQNTANSNNLLTGLGQEERAYRVGQMDTGNQLFARGIDQARSNLTGTYGMLSNGVDRGIGILGGVGGMYGSDAAAQGQSLQGMLGSLAGTGTLADLFKKKTPGGYQLPSGNTLPGTPPIMPQTLGTVPYKPQFAGLKF